MKRVLVCLFAIFLVGISGCGGKTAPLSDGSYTVEVTLTGGTGRTTVESPTTLTVTNGQPVAAVQWSSPFYEWMQVGETQYFPTKTEQGAKFEIPVTLDADMPVSAQTVAMSEPHVVEYTLRFDAATVKAVG